MPKLNVYYILLSSILILIISSCSSTKPDYPIDNYKEGKKLAQEFIITDGHVDLPYRLKVQNFRFQKELLGIPIETDEGDFDFKRSIEGGLNAPFMSIYVPSRLQDEYGASKILADSLIDMVEGICKTHPDKFRIAKSPQDVERFAERGIIALPLGMENGSPIEDAVSNVSHFKNRGISYITLTHALNNRICDSSYDTTRIHNGLSRFGEIIVQEMNRVGIMIDISHVSDSTFYDVMKLTQSPVIASHSSARYFTPGFERNMGDDMIKALAKNNGVIMINFGSTFIDAEIRSNQDSLGRAYRAEIASLGLKHGDEGTDAIEDKFFKNNPLMWSDVKRVADHIDHIVKIAGVDHVGFGSDFDGVGDSLPKGLKDVSDYPILIAELLNRGYSEKDIEKICYLNLKRVWNTVIKNAEKENF